jgi:hypothetical protein
MHDRDDYANFSSQLEQQTKQRDRVRPTRNRNSDAVSRFRQIMLANVLQNRLGQTLHEIMLHRVSGRRVERDG